MFSPYIWQIMEIRLNGSTLFYQKRGNGGQCLLLFHGVGDDHSAFDALSQELAHQYTFYSFDLFFHGVSSRSDNTAPLSKNEWKDLIEAFLRQESINRFSVLGFSMGARLAMATAEAFAPQINNLFLVAPDGIVTSPWYWLAVRFPFRKVFESFVRRPSNFERLLEVAHKFRLIDAGTMKFARLQMRSSEHRQRVYNTWMCFRDLSFDTDHLFKTLARHDAQTFVLLGSKDKMIDASSIQRKLRHTSDCDVRLVDATHYGIMQKLPAMLRADYNAM